jgi:hypothetical protein
MSGDLQKLNDSMLSPIICDRSGSLHLHFRSFAYLRKYGFAHRLYYTIDCNQKVDTQLFEAYREEMPRIDMTTIEEQIVRLYLRGHRRDQIAEAFRRDTKRITRTLQIYVQTQQIPAPLRMGRPPKMTPAIRDVNGVKTFQEATLSAHFAW